jgi:hypothetical protein
MKTPVALIIFNRPEHTQKVFSQITNIKPSKLFIIADGPRDGNKEDLIKCEATRNIVENIDWDCDVHKNYSNVNLGAGIRPATGISWVFENVEEAIILEDDCIPQPSFFRFCEELLEKYHNDERVMTICGRNHLAYLKKMKYSYSFQRVMSCWGWATWRRAWKHHDIEIKLWPELRSRKWLLDILGDRIGYEHWKRLFDRYYKYRGKIDAWDFQWAFACWAQNAFAVIPSKNLVKNIGFGDDATHTKDQNRPFRSIDSSEINFPLKHPPHIIRDLESELLLFEYFYRKNSRKTHILNKWNRLIKKFMLFIFVLHTTNISFFGSI